MSDRAAILIHEAAADDDALAERLAFVLAGEIETLGRNDFFGKSWAGSFRKRVRELDQGLRGRALDRGNVVRMQKLRLRAGGGPAISQHRHHSPVSSDAFQNHGDALANADAHGAEGITPLGAQQLIERSDHEAPTAGAEWMAYGDGSAIGVDVRGIVGEAEFAKDRESLGGEGFVQFDHVHL